jgi:serine/threonine protein kinase
MDTETSREQALFEAALPLEDPAEREAFLDRACAGDAALRSRIARLLEEHPGSERFFTECRSEFAFDDAAAPSPGIPGDRSCAEKIGASVGRYKLLRQLGEGGCGAVYLAEQEEPVRRRVALKIIKLGMDTKNVISRFEAERQALALMDHPNIAKVLDAGATDSGRPYFVMDLVDGIRITHYCDERQLGVRQRLSLLIQVCHAIQHAHQKGVIHRDIKPSNVLVQDHDGVPVPKVIDFGIAKATEGSLSDSTTFTSDGQFIGTPAYMSPEQAEIGALDVDTRSDIYSLGILLYELLVGRTPFDPKALLQSGLFEMRRILREQEPRKPSTLLASLAPADFAAVAKHRHIEPHKLVRLLTGDLDWIVMKALEKDRRRRYATANALAVDVQHYLNNEPVAARPPSRLYRLQKLVWRNKAVYASGALVLLSLIAALGLSTHFFFRERDARQRAEKAQAEAERARANETQLRREAEARQNVTQAAVFVTHGQMEEADALLASLPAELLSPSTEAATVFRAVGEWHLLAGRWKQAADRYAVLVQVNYVDKTEQSAAVTVDSLLAAPLLIQSGQDERYDRMRRVVLSRLAGTTYPSASEQLVKISLLLPADESLMARLAAPADCIAKSLDAYVPNATDGFYPATWRAFALALFEYRRGNFSACMNWLQKCSGYPDQSPSCVATAHLLMAMACHHLGKGEQAQSEFTQGRAMVEAYFRGRLEVGNDKVGRIAGWIMTPIFLHEAANLTGSEQWTNSGQSGWAE